MRWRTPRDPTDRGAAAVEFALILVFLFLPLTFGIIQYGYYFLQANSAEHAAREGARLAAVGVADCKSWRGMVVTRGVSAQIVAEGPGKPTFTGATQVGQTITVTFQWQPIRFGFPYVPFIPAGNQTETAQTRAEFTKEASC